MSRKDNAVSKEIARHATVMEIKGGIPTVTEAIGILQELVQRKPEWATALLAVQTQGNAHVGSFAAIGYAEMIGGKNDGSRFVILEGLA